MYQFKNNIENNQVESERNFFIRKQLELIDMYGHVKSIGTGMDNTAPTVCCRRYKKIV